MTSQVLLLVPVDFSETSHKAFDLSKEFSAKLGAEIVLLHVFEPPSLFYPDVPAELIDSIYREAKPAAQRTLEALSAQAGGARTLLREGRAGPEIVRAAEEVSPKLIVIGTHGRKGIQRLFLGSVAEYVLRRAGAPVVTVRGNAEE